MNDYRYYKEEIERNFDLSKEEKEEYRKILETIGENAKTPIIFNTYHLSNILGVNWKIIKQLIRKPEENYHTFYITKKMGGKRQISVPSPDLMYVQRKIKESILENIKIHDAAYGFRKKRSIVDNAKVHLNQEIVLNIDIENFFPAVQSKRIYYIFHDLAKYDSKVATCLTKLVTFHDKLPQGAPTSPILSNIVSYMLDIRLQRLAEKMEIHYTRYADDITFSGSKEKVNVALLRLVEHIIKENGFQVNKKKTRFATKGTRQEVTGLIVNNDEVNIPKNYIKEIRQEIYYIKKYGIESHREHTGIRNRSYREHLLGKILYVRKINFEKGEALLEQFNQIDW